MHNYREFMGGFTDWAQTIAASDSENASLRQSLSFKANYKAAYFYVLPNSAATSHTERRYPHKRVKVVDNGISGRAP